METNDIIPRWFQYKEECKITTVDSLGNSQTITAQCGMRRKGIAIASNKQNIYLIDKNNHVLFQTEQKGTDWRNGDYSHELRRSITGYYILIHNGYYRISRPGRDDDYVDDMGILGVFDENGVIIEKLVDNPRHKEFAIGQYPIEMGCNLLYYEHAFYDVESLEMKFYIPKDFQVETIFKDEVCTLDYVRENKELIAIVKDSEVIDCINIRDTELLLEIVRKTGDLSVFNFCEMVYSRDQIKYHLKEKIIDEYKTKLGVNIEYLKTNKGNYTKSKNISNRVFSREQFLHEKDLLNCDELKILADIRRCLIDIYQNNFEESLMFRFARLENFIDLGIKVILFNDFFFLVCEGTSTYRHSGYFYWIYDYNGNRLSESIYEGIHYPQRSLIDHSSLVTNIRFYNHVFTYTKSKAEESGIIIIEDGFVREMQYPSILFDKKYHGYMNMYVFPEFIKQDGKYYTFTGKEIPLHFMHIKEREIIRNIEFEPFPHFEYYLNYLGRISETLPRIIDNKLCLPIEDEFYKCIECVKERNKQLHKNISKIKHIGTYNAGTEKEYSLYYIEYRPKAVCNTMGQISLFENLGNIYFIYKQGTLEEQYSSKNNE